MEVTVSLFIFLLGLAFIFEYIDASLGMGYGTILSPLLIIIGFNPVTSIPALLFSQAFGGFAASIFHHKLGNVSFHTRSKDLKIVFVISLSGIIAAVIAAIISISIPKIFLTTYIGVLVLAMGIIILGNFQFKFSWKKIVGVGILSAFNKGLSGGGFGPVVTSGQIMSGQGHKGAIGTTTLAEAPICLTAFLTYLVGRTIIEIKTPVWNIPFADFGKTMFSPELFQWELFLALLIGSVIVAPFAALTTKKLNKEKIHLILGVFIVVLGLFTLVKTYILK